MSNLGFILDGVILVFLAVTIFYAVRLTIFFKAFRDSRDSVEALLKNLNATINHAQDSIQNMQGMTAETRGDLQDVINEASFLSDELRFMNETGDNLAERLEKLADRNRELVDLMEDHGGIGRPKIKVDQKGFNHIDDDVWGLKVEEEIEQETESRPLKRKSKAPKVSLKSQAQEEPDSAPRSGFMIADREYDDEEDTLDDDGAWSTLLESESVETANTNFPSQAEKDLYEALQHQSPAKKSSRLRESA